MKKNLIIIVFCLFMLGTFCFNYSYAKTVEKTDAYCKKIWENFTNKIDEEENNFISNQLNKDLNCTPNEDGECELDILTDEELQHITNRYNWSIENEFKKTCEQAWCYYIWSKCLSCDGIKLNTNVPFIWNCIPSDSQSEAFPLFIGGLIKFAMSLLMLAGFLCILIWGVKISLWDTWWWRDLIMKVVRALAALGASGVILKIINPNFFS